MAALGANTLKGMCVTVGVRAYLGNSISYPAMRNLWRHNLACAMIAERIAGAGSIDRDTAYTAGILHDVGRMALAVIQPKGYAALLDKHHGPAASMLLAEREMFGLDHCEAGRQLIADWKLPESFKAVVADHHSESRPDERMGSCGVGKGELRDGIGNRISQHSPDAQQQSTRNCSDELPAHEQNLFHPDAETLTGEIARSIHAIESF